MAKRGRRKPLTIKQIQAIHAKNKGYVPVLVIGNRKNEKVFVGAKVDGDTTKYASGTKAEAWYDANREGWKKIESRPKGTLRLSTVVKANQIVKPTEKRPFKNNPVLVSVKTNNAKGSKTKERIIAERRPGEKNFRYNPELKKTKKGRKFIKEFNKEVKRKF